jgi:hypothetical protein
MAYPGQQLRPLQLATLPAMGGITPLPGNVPAPQHQPTPPGGFDAAPNRFDPPHHRTPPRGFDDRDGHRDYDQGFDRHRDRDHFQERGRGFDRGHDRDYPPRGRETRCPTYSGDNQIKDPIEGYIDRVDTTAEMNRWDDFVTASHVRVSLTGPASMTVLSADKSVTSDWSSLKALLYRRFVPAGQTDRFEAEFKNRCIKPGESYEDYSQQLHLLLMRWQPRAVGADKDTTLLAQFCLGLNDRETGRQIKITPHMTLEAAISLAGQAKGYNQLLNARNLGKPVAVYTADVTDSYECGRAYASNPTPEYMDTVICAKCKGTGHFWRDCVSGTVYVPSWALPSGTDQSQSALARVPRPTSSTSSYKSYSDRKSDRSPSTGRSTSQGSYGRGDRNKRSFTPEQKRSPREGGAPKSPNGDRPRQRETAPRTEKE